MIPLYLECSADYRTMPEAERDAKCGCGTERSKAVPDTVYGLSIKPACCIHDYDYSVGKTDQDKIDADYRFLRNMLAIINNAPGTINALLRMPRRRRALKYYEAVNRFGHGPFWSGKERNIEAAK